MYSKATMMLLNLFLESKILIILTFVSILGSVATEMVIPTLPQRKLCLLSSLQRKWFYLFIQKV